MNKKEKIKKILNETGHPEINVKKRDDIVFLEGELSSWNDIVNIGLKVSKAKLYTHTVNNIKLKGFTQKVNKPSINDLALDNKKVDILVIGGGVVGAAILRELTKYKLNALLVEKGEDLALAASSRNDGCIHVGVDLHKRSNKLKYLVKSKEIIKDLCKDIDVDYHEDGQTVCFKSNLLKPVIRTFFKIRCKRNHITDWN